MEAEAKWYADSKPETKHALTLTDEEQGTILHALRSNAKADRERVKTLEAEHQTPAIKGLAEVFARQAEQQEKLVEKIEAHHG